MKVQLEWTEEITYRTEVEISADEQAKIRQWLTMDHKGEYHPEEETDEPLTADDVYQWFTSGDESDWFDRWSAITDVYGVDDRSLDSVTEVKE